jgi:chaperonin GroES
LIASDNATDMLEQDQLDYIGGYICEGIKNDLTSREGWEQDIDEWLKLAAQVREDKSFPWPDSANVKYPILTIASTQFASRAYSALLSGPDYVQGRVIGKDESGEKTDIAIKIGKHMSYQLKEEMTEWEQDMDRLLHTLPITGTAFKKSYYDPSLLRNVSEFVSPKDLIIDYHAKSLEKAYRKTHILNYTQNELVSLMRSGVFQEYTEDELQRPESSKPRTNDNDSQNMKQSQTDKSSKHELYECHTWLDLDGDGYEEPYIITVHRGSEKVMRIVSSIAYGEDSIQKNEDDEIYYIAQKQYFTGFIFIPDPSSGVYGLGFGSLLGPLNISINTIINQLLDAGTLSNMQSGFIASNIQPKSGDTAFRPGEWKVVNSYGADIQSGIVPLPVREPSNVLFSLLGMLENASMKMASVVDILTGEIPGQNTKATVAMAAIEQGLKVFSSIYKRCHRSLKDEYKKLYEENAMFLPVESYVSIFDAQGDAPETVKQTDYQIGQNDVVPYSDPNVSSEQQRLAKIQVIEGLLSLGTINREEYTRRLCVATDQPDIDSLMDVPEPGPDPMVMLEQEKFKHEKDMDILDRKFAAIDLDIKANQTRIDGILKIAKAESEEEGQQVAQYNKYLDQLMAAETQLMQQKRDMFDQRQQLKAQKEQEQAAAQQQAAQPAQ